MSELIIETARVFRPLLEPARYKGAHGGRGSGKSHFFAEAAVERCIVQPGCRVLCGREVQKSLAHSAKRLIEDKIAQLRAPGFRTLADRTEAPGGGVIIYQGLQDHTVESIKSFEGFDVAWIEEANKLKQRSLDLLRPTIRKPGSELWFSWNPQRRSDPVDVLLRGPVTRELGAVVVEANWKDNPWFPAVLEGERAFDEQHHPETYAHVWEGAYATVVRGAYYADALALADREGRITNLAADPLLPVRACWDLGVSDATSIWIVQYVGREIRVLDYIEGEGQPLAYYVAELRRRGWGEALCVLPHDGAHRDALTAVKFEDHLKAAGFKTLTIGNQGAGAARLRIEAVRRIFPQLWFDRVKTEPGREALGAYHERRQEDREVGLGPEHDWSSHAADAFGLIPLSYDPPKIVRPASDRVFTASHADAGTQWLGA